MGLVALGASFGLLLRSAPNDTAVVQAHVAAFINQTFREPTGELIYPWLVPAGPYQSCWDWDSLFLGIAGLQYGSGPYFAGTFKNYLHKTNLSTGNLPGGLTPTGPTGVLFHAKPVIIQGAWLAARATGDTASFKQFQPAMEALLSYWQRAPRVDPLTGLAVWHDQLESGADDLVLSECPSSFSPECWDEAEDAFTLASPDVMTFLVREHIAYANFLKAWAGVPSPADPGAAGAGGGAASALDAETAAAVARQEARVQQLTDSLNTYLWHWTDDSYTTGYYAGYNVSTQTHVTNRTYQMAWPLWSGLAANASQVAAAVAAISAPDMWTAFGVRSTSSADPRYSNANIIDPYSNWRGPVWINANAVLAYSLRASGQPERAAALADAVVGTLAADLRATSTWHECYDSDTGAALAAPGFLSWNCLGATLQADVAAGRDPFSLAY